MAQNTVQDDRNWVRRCNREYLELSDAFGLTNKDFMNSRMPGEGFNLYGDTRFQRDDLHRIT